MFQANVENLELEMKLAVAAEQRSEEKANNMKMSIIEHFKVEIDKLDKRL